MQQKIYTTNERFLKKTQQGKHIMKANGVKTSPTITLHRQYIVYRHCQLKSSLTRNVLGAIENCFVCIIQKITSCYAELMCSTQKMKKKLFTNNLFLNSL